MFTERAENARVWDVDGREYIDFAGGIAVLNTGHRHPKVIEAVRAQLDLVTHTAFQVSAYAPYIELAEKLNARAPIDGPAKTILFTTGAEAVENAVKIARAATGRSAVIAFTGAFHGRTALTMAMTGKVAPYKQQFGASPPDVFHVPFPLARYGVDLDASLMVLAHILRADVEASRVAAIVLEPVQGEGGFHQAPPELMRALRALCDANGILLIADEVQTGFARTGKLFAMQHYDVRADLIAMAKSLAGGFPLSGVTGRRRRQARHHARIGAGAYPALVRRFRRDDPLALPAHDRGRAVRTRAGAARGCVARGLRRMTFNLMECCSR
jgi:4-aminobutyrate aminotransferase/(S)-3-amino-2-methylpropionate transaminase